MFNLEEQGGEAKAVGWISMSDMFMLCTIVMLAVAVAFALSLDKTDLKLATVEGEYQQYRNTNTLTIEEMKEKAAQLTKESGGYKTQAASLDEELSLSKIQSAKFQSRSESLASELAAQNSKLNSVQSEFDKYRNINTATMGELKTELMRLNKLTDDYKTNAAALSLQINTVDSKLAESERQAAALKNDRDKFKAEGERLVSELAKQKSKFEADLTSANGDLTRLAAELARVNGEYGKAHAEWTLATGELNKSNTELARVNADLAKATADLAKAGGDSKRMLADLNTTQSSYTALLKEDNDLKLKLNVLRGEKESAEAKLADLQRTVIGLTGEIGEMKPQLTKLKMDLSGANLRNIDLEKAVFEKINRAKLVVTVAAQDVPKGFTLELFVTDPLANECGPFSEVIFNDGDEIGVLQQSVDFKSGQEGSQKAVFYSMRPVYSRMEGGTYRVRAMIRQNNNDETAQLPHSVMVTCSVDLPNITGPDAHKVAQLEVTSPGVIKKVRRNGQLTPATQYKSMWPWEPVYHYERTICDFQIRGDRITNFRDIAKLSAEFPVTVQSSGPAVRGPEEHRIDSIRNRSGN